MIYEEGDWRNDAACLNTDPELFFGTEREETAGMSARQLYSATRTREAKAVCNGDMKKGIPACPVRAQCLETAFRLKVDDGIWGGMTSNERRNLRRRQASAGKKETKFYE